MLKKIYDLVSGALTIAKHQMNPIHPALDFDFTDRERIFRAPLFSLKTVLAIHRLAPHTRYSTREKSRQSWEKEVNIACWREFDVLGSLLEAIPRPKKVLDIGSGFGRSTIFFQKKLGWDDSVFHLFDGNGKSNKYTQWGPRFEDSFCGDLALLEQVLKHNQIANYEIHDAGKKALRQVPGPYDFLYSFYSIGYHWSLENFLNDIFHLMHEKSLAVFTLSPMFKPFERLKEINYAIVDQQGIYPGHSVKLFLLGKSDYYGELFGSVGGKSVDSLQK